MSTGCRNELRCSPEENARRVAQPDRRRYEKLTDAAILLGGIDSRAFDPPAGMAANVVIDTTHLTASETARGVRGAWRTRALDVVPTKVVDTRRGHSC